MRRTERSKFAVATFLSLAICTRLPSPLALLLCLCAVSVVRGFYIPGVTPTEYEEGDTLEIKVRCSSVGWWVGCEWAGTVFGRGRRI